MQTRVYNKWIVALLAMLGLIAALAGCGGGGGGSNNGGTPVTVTGKVLRAETNQPDTTAATVAFSGGPTATTSTTDGSFTVNNVSSSITSATISAAAPVQPRTISFKLKAGVTNDLGNIYVSDTGYNATVHGRIVTAGTAGATTAVGGSTVTIANVTTTAASDGTFTLTGLPVGLGQVDGIYGKVVTQGYDDKLITADNLQFALVAGNNNIGDLLITKPSGTQPPPPYNITGIVKANGAAAPNLPVTLFQNGNAVANTTTDANGTYFFWVPTGTYTVTAINASTSKSVNVTLSSLDSIATANTISF